MLRDQKPIIVAGSVNLHLVTHASHIPAPAETCPIVTPAHSEPVDSIRAKIAAL